MVIVFLLLKKNVVCTKMIDRDSQKILISLSLSLASGIILARKRMFLDYFIPYVVVQSLISDFQIIIYTINLDYVCFCQLRCSLILWFVEVN